MASRPTSSFNQNRRMISEADRMKIFGSGINSYNPVDNQAVPLSASYLNPGIQNFPNNNQSVVPPPLPPRADTSRYSRYSNYNSYYSPYSRYSPGLYSPGFGNYRTPYSRYGMPHDSYNSFIQLAEESTRPAFESIESVVDIVGSISMMLESTYHAVYSSYNAILGVVDQFARLKDHLAQVLSFLALLRGLKYLCLKILYILRLRKDNPSIQAAWNKAKSASENSELSRFQGDGKSPWPFFMFIGLVIGAPWLMFKLLAKSVAKKSFDVKSWQGKDGYGLCIGNYDFKSARRGELSFNAGEVLHIAPKYLQGNVPRGWILASNKNNEVGLIPMNYLKTSSKPPQKVRRPDAVYVPVVEPASSRSSDNPFNNEINPFASDDEPSSSENVPDSVPKEDHAAYTDQNE